MGIKKLGKLNQIGHRVTGDRRGHSRGNGDRMVAVSAMFK
jgi:hypothetical protein